MNDSFSYGATAKRRPRPARADVRRAEPGDAVPNGTRPARAVDPVKMGAAVLVIVVLGAASVGVMSVVRDGGGAAADAARDAIGKVGVARDAEAQLTLTRVAAAATAVLAGSATGSTGEVTIDALRAIEPAFTYTAEPSTGPGVVSVATAATGWSAAVASRSGTCLWVLVDPEGVQTFGSGTPCTGAAAAGASDPSW